VPAGDEFNLQRAFGRCLRSAALGDETNLLDEAAEPGPGLDLAVHLLDEHDLAERTERERRPASGRSSSIRIG
jgi:hypothetical protein